MKTKLLKTVVLLFTLLTLKTPAAERTATDPANPPDYPTRLSPAGSLAIVRHPPPADYHRERLAALPAYRPGSHDNPFQVDLRGCDLSQLVLTNRLADLLHADFDAKTRWPACLPQGFEPARLMSLGQDPGLRVRELHAQGITGKGVGIGIIDQGLLVDHVEYAERLRLYEEIHCADVQSAMHGPAVASIAVGKTAGVAPGADLYYIAETHGVFHGGHDFDWDFRYLAKALDRLLEVNRALPPARKIRVVSISVGWTPKRQGYQEMVAAVERARQAKVFVVSVEMNAFRFMGLGREPLADPNAFGSYGPGRFWADNLSHMAQAAAQRRCLFVPMDSRGLASPTGQEDYVFYADGGMSWATPWVAGLYALACQVKPEVTPEEFWALALKTGEIIRVRQGQTEIPFGPIAHPVALLTALKQ